MSYPRKRVGHDAIVSIAYARKNPDRVNVLRQASKSWVVLLGTRVVGGTPFAKHSQAVRYAHTVASAIIAQEKALTREVFA